VKQPYELELQLEEMVLVQAGIEVCTNTAAAMLSPFLLGSFVEWELTCLHLLLLVSL